MLKGSSLAEFCRERRLDVRNVYGALNGKRSGPKAKALARQVIAASRGDDA